MVDIKESEAETILMIFLLFQPCDDQQAAQEGSDAENTGARTLQFGGQTPQATTQQQQQQRQKDAMVQDTAANRAAAKQLVRCLAWILHVVWHPWCLPSGMNLCWDDCECLCAWFTTVSTVTVAQKLMFLSCGYQLTHFLQGKQCFAGGHGWWLHEFCYQKHVKQVHQNGDGTKIEILLVLILVCPWCMRAISSSRLFFPHLHFGIFTIYFKFSSPFLFFSFIRFSNTSSSTLLPARIQIAGLATTFSLHITNIKAAAL